MGRRHINHLINIIYNKQKIINSSNLGISDTFIWGYLCAIGKKLKDPVIVLNEIQYLNNKLDNQIITPNRKYQELIGLCQNSINIINALKESIIKSKPEISEENVDCEFESDSIKLNLKLKDKLQSYVFTHHQNDVKSHYLTNEFNNTCTLSNINNTTSIIYNLNVSNYKKLRTLRENLCTPSNNSNSPISPNNEESKSLIKQTDKYNKSSQNEFFTPSMTRSLTPGDMIKRFGFLRTFAADSIEFV